MALWGPSFFVEQKNAFFCAAGQGEIATQKGDASGAPERRRVYYLSLDVEASGPFPGQFSLVSLAAVPVRRSQARGPWMVDDSDTFYAELQPLEGADELPAATRVHGLTKEYLLAQGQPPAQALADFAAYLARMERRWGRTLAAGWPASFDAPFVGWYSQRFLGHNPLGYKSFDIGSYAQGLFRCDRKKLHFRLSETGWWDPKNPYPHNALQDALKQAQLLKSLLNSSGA